MLSFKEIKRYYSCKFMTLIKKRGGFGLNEFLGIAAALIIAALVIIPGLIGFSDDMMDGLTGWWEVISNKIFLKSLP
jgi:hypothetical protein